MSLRSRLIIVSVSVFVVAVTIAAFFWYQARSTRGLDIAISAPEQVLLGVPFTITVNVANGAQNVLQDIKLNLNIPEGVVFVGESQDKTVEFKDIGDLGVGSLIKEEFQLMAISGEDTFKRLEVDVGYLPFSLASRFEKSEAVDVGVRGSGIVLDLTAPAKVFSGEGFELVISYRNVSDRDFRNLKLRMEYPPVFSFLKSSVASDSGNNIWELGDLRSGSEGTIKINGSVIGPAESFFDFKGSIEGEFLGESYIVSSRSITQSVETSPLSLNILLNGDKDVIVRPGDTLNYTINYANNIDIGLRDVIISAQLVGDMFDLTSLTTNGSLRSFDKTIIWNAANTPNLAVVSPGASGKIEFRIDAKDTYAIKRLSDKNFVLKINATIESPTVPQFVAAAKTISVTSQEAKVAGKATIDAKAFFRDAASGIVNKGPMPPKVGKATNFTIHWLITNYGTDIKNIEVKAFLGGNVRFIGEAKSNTTTIPVYNERTQEIVWMIDSISAGSGVLSRPSEAIFQVEAIPSVSDIGKYMTLLQPTSLKAADDFTGLEIQASDSGLNTELKDDFTITSQQGVVVQ
ncbi:MAG: hypothetical protein AAB454_02440 [Patescibacteria group bacterium]